MNIPSAEDFAAMMERQRQEYERAKPERIALFKAQILPTHIDQWPESLHALSVVSLYESFPMREYEGVHNAPDGGDTVPFVRTVSDQIERLRNEFGGDAFFRLGSRSPKDWWYGHPSVGEDRAATQPRGALTHDIAASFLWSERVLDDLVAANDVGYVPVLCARAFIAGIEPHREFRCFMENRELAGISVYRAWEEGPKSQIVADPKRWENAIRDWFPAFRNASPLDSVVFDTVVLDDGVLLLEINPFVGSTYPAHFLGKELDGGFRYIGDGDSAPVR